MLKIAVCDDEVYFRKRIKDIISDYMAKWEYNYSIICFESGESFLESFFCTQEYDIIFLDINMKGMNGIETARMIREKTKNISVVFVTAYITYALEGYKVDAVRYILKGDRYFEESMKECLDAIIEKRREKEIRYTFEFQNGITELVLDRILYAESKLHKIIFFVIMSNGLEQYYMYNKLDVMESILEPFGFCRIHQSFLVNMKHVKSVIRYRVSLYNGTELSISKKYYKEVRAKYIKAGCDI